MGYEKIIRIDYVKFLGMGYEKFLGMGYEKFLRIGSNIFPVDNHKKISSPGQFLPLHCTVFIPGISQLKIFPRKFL